MKKVTKAVVSAVLATSMMFGMTSCSLFDKAGKQCKEVGDEFMKALIERDAEDMAELCSDEDEAVAIFTPYCGDMEAVEAVLSRATFEAGKPACKTKDKKGEIEYTITLPDYESCLDEDPEDVDELEDLLDDTKDTIEIKVTLEFKLKKDDWLIDNAEDIAEDVFEEILDTDWGFESPLVGMIDHYYFYGSDEGFYDSPYCLDLDIYFTQSVNEDVSFDVVYNGNVVYSERTYAGNYAFCYCYSDELEGMSDFEDGEYTYNVYDSNGALICSATCSVDN